MVSFWVSFSMYNVVVRLTLRWQNQLDFFNVAHIHKNIETLNKQVYHTG